MTVDGTDFASGARMLVSVRLDRALPPDPQFNVERCADVTREEGRLKNLNFASGIDKGSPTLTRGRGGHGAD